MSGEASPPAAEEATDYDHLLFARGFLIARSPETWTPEGWARHEFGGWIVRRDPRLAYAEAEAPRRLLGRAARVACLGVILDADRPEDGPDAVLARLADALARSEDAMLRALDTAAGRFVLLYETGGRAHVVGDAAGTKQTFRHDREAALVSSHADLIARNLSDAERETGISPRRGCPGLSTRWRHVDLLTPNMRLRLDDGELRRFWPRERLARVSVADAAEEVARLMIGTLRHLAGRFELHPSITAGLDSRVTLALSGGLPTRPFTYFRREDAGTDALDRAFARWHRTQSGTPVRVLRLRRSGVPQAFQKVLAANTIGSHMRELAWSFHSELAQDGRALHVRSNVSEVGRQFYGRPAWSDPPQGRDFARLHLRSRKTVPVAEVFEEIERFERFAEVTGILRCAQMVDLASLLYWEHRMGAWLANALSESDVGVDTVSPFNCRRVLAMLLSVPRRDRSASAVHRRIIATRAPELTRHPVNGEVLWS